MVTAKIMIFSVIGGAIVTLLTGLISSTPPMFVGAKHYGYPLAWLVRLVLAQSSFHGSQCAEPDRGYRHLDHNRGFNSRCLDKV